MIEVKVSAQTAPELADLVRSLAQQFGVSLSKVEADTVVEAETQEVSKEVKEEKIKKESKKEEKKETKKETKKEEKKETVEAPASDYTKEDIATACQKVSSKINLDAAKDILSKFDSEKGEPCRRISDVLVSDYAGFIVKCDEALKK